MAFKQATTIRKVFNTSGLAYRQRNLKDVLPNLSDEQALHLLSTDPNLIKRPLLVTSTLAIAGFDPEIWQRHIDLANL